MRITEALDNEKNRSERELWGKVYLHHDGKFYHAYEWSAWLIKAFVCTEEMQKERGDAKMLSACLFRSKKSEYALLGFPVESASKYIVQYKDVKYIENDDIVVEVELPFGEDYTYEAVSSMFEEWRAKCDVKESKKQGDRAMRDNAAVAVSKSGLFSILTEILSYPVEKSTPSENIDFISDLKQKAASLL